MSIKFETKETETYTLVSFDLGTVPAEPKMLETLKLPEVNTKKGVILNGRGPIWLYGFLIHFYHPTKWVATNDPRLGAVVIESHDPIVKVGEIIKI